MMKYIRVQPYMFIDKILTLLYDGTRKKGIMSESCANQVYPASSQDSVGVSAELIPGEAHSTNALSIDK